MKRDWRIHDEFHFPGMINGPEKRGREIWVSSFTEDGRPLAIMISWAGQTAKIYDRENGRLIAAAPELREALQCIIADPAVLASLTQFNLPALLLAQAALDKADGVSSDVGTIKRKET